MGYTDILYKRENGVARITINRPEVYNAVRGRTTDEMVLALEDAEADDGTVAALRRRGPRGTPCLR